MDFLSRIQGGLVVSCYAGADYNAPFSAPEPMLAMVASVVEGGAVGVRVSLEHVALIKEHLDDVPVMGIKKVYQGAEMRITPTLAEAVAIYEAGADAISIDATGRSRFDDGSLEDFVETLKPRIDIPILGDISTYEEGVLGMECGLDAVSTTLSGYTPYSPDYGRLGDIPPKAPDYDLVERLSADLSIPVIAEGRYNTPEKAASALARGAHAVVVGTAITNPQKLTELFVAALG
jgi:N-acylglucosamine-6-phosphate 2-epimerase